MEFDSGVSLRVTDENGGVARVELTDRDSRRSSCVEQ
jgi:hypothetical protein